MALVESLMLTSSAMPTSNFIRAYDELLTYDEKTKCLGIEREFKVVCYSYYNSPCYVLLCGTSEYGDLYVLLTRFFSNDSNY